MLVSSAARYLWLALLASVLIHLSGCSSTGESEYKSVKQTSSDSTFPIPPGIEDNVEFWRKVYGEMDRSQVVIHDNEYMSVTYEVIQVPGSGESRRAFVKGKQQEYRDRLAILERKVTYGESLTSAEEEMKAQLEAVGGRNAIFGAADRVRTQQGMRERFRSGMEISGRYDQAFREIFRKHGVPEDLAFLPHVESSFQSQARSGVGAAGLWQFMPATGRVYSLQVDHKLDERMDPLLACEGAARYLSAAHRKLGSWPLAITSYNHGQGGIAKAKSQHGSDIGKIVENYKGESFGFDSRNFYSQFVAAREVAGNPKKYFPDGVAFHKAHDSDRLVLKQPMSAQQLAGSYGLSVNQLDDLNPSWSNAIVKGNASIPAGASVWLPAGTTERASGQPGASAPAMVARQEKAESASAFEPESEFISVTRVTRPEPVLARAGAKPVVARSDVRTDTRARTAIAKAEIQAKPDFDMDAPKPRSANLRSDTKAKTSLAMADPKAEPDKVLPKTHVVKANETLFQVAVKYDTSVDELKKLNKLSAKDNTIKTGQKLKVSG